MAISTLHRPLPTSPPNCAPRTAPNGIDTSPSASARIGYSLPRSRGPIDSRLANALRSSSRALIDTPPTMCAQQYPCTISWSVTIPKPVQGLHDSRASYTSSRITIYVVVRVASNALRRYSTHTARRFRYTRVRPQPGETELYLTLDIFFTYNVKSSKIVYYYPHQRGKSTSPRISARRALFIPPRPQRR